MVAQRLRKRRGRGIFYGWWIVGAGFLIQMLQASLFFHSFGAYFVFLQGEFGWSRTALSGAFALQRMESGILGPLQGWLIDRVGPRAMVRVGTVIAGAGLILFSQIHSMWQFYAAFLTIALGSSLGGFMAVSATVANWFMRMRTRAMGITMAGMSTGGLLVPLVAWSLSHYGWRQTSFVSGLIIIAVGVPLAQILRHTPEKHGYFPDGAGVESEKPDASAPAAPGRPATGRGYVEVSFTALEALKTRAFWFISLGHAASLLVVSSLSLHLIPHIVQRFDVSVQVAGTMVALMTAVMIFSQVFGGVLGDKINKRHGLTVCLLGHSMALFGLAFSHTLWQVALSVVIYGLSWGSRGPMLMSLRAEYFGRASFATIMGFSSLIMMLGMMAGPIFAGVMADRLGDYQLAFVILASVAGVFSVFFFLARAPQLPLRLQRA